MALLKCPECGHDVSDKAEKCPNCGCPVSDILESLNQKIEEPKPTQESKCVKEEEEIPPVEVSTEEFQEPLDASKVLGRVFLIVFVIAGILAVVFIMSANKGENPVPSPKQSTPVQSPSYQGTSSRSSLYSSREIEATAFVLAEEAVKGKLKAPSTAKFCKQSECDFDYLGNNQYQMSGWVDAENGFGAMIRSNWYIVAELDGLKMKLVSVLVG